MNRFGADAPVQAALRIDELTEAADLAGALVWKNILAAVDELQRAETRVGERKP